MSDLAWDRCSDCGRAYLDQDKHERICGKIQDSPFNGTCPMCGERYEGYLDHINNCSGAD